MEDPRPFVEFPKIARLRRPIVVTEKLDGTNACVWISETLSPTHTFDEYGWWTPERLFDEGIVRAGSRTRWVTPDQDNFGFARWVREHARELIGLGAGTHYGEWWGQGIQRGYGLKEKRFSLFNVAKWGDDPAFRKEGVVRPPCCSVVPVLTRWETFDASIVQFAVESLEVRGSVAAPGFMKPEGVVVFHAASGQLFKQTIERDEEPKGRR